ncbi:proline-rich protein 5-like [Electrophorus electricus]|uniref:proline-rich protein 5-like n=1 Tax=Electrophorus electricus TaxID=8005 RepID=UPI0015D09086|nr:proline-rich protein 5-like [Electrophorus electricus]XP_035376824.1 proline-rich protein 5-like [Electrophorus electricus]
MSSSQQRTCNQSSIHLPVLSQLQPASSMLHGPSGSDMNRIYSAVSKVFQGKELQMNELYSLNESIRWLLKTEMGSFIKEYYQNQLLNKGFTFIFEEVQLHEGERQLFFLAKEWLRFFSEILPTLQAIFYPLQGQELTVRQMALLGFRDLVLMRLPVEDLLPTNLPLLPTSITQMLLVLQGVHDPRGPSVEYCRLEKMLEMVVSPYLWNYKNKSYVEDTRETRHLIQPEIRITQHISEGSLLSPLMEEEGEMYLERRGCSLRCYSMTDGLSDIADMHLLSVTRTTHCGLTDNCGTSEEMMREHNRNLFQVSHTF